MQKCPEDDISMLLKLFNLTGKYTFLADLGLEMMALIQHLMTPGNLCLKVSVGFMCR